MAFPTPEWSKAIPKDVRDTEEWGNRVGAEQPAHRSAAPGVGIVGAAAFSPEEAPDDAEAGALRVELSDADLDVGELARLLAQLADAGTARRMAARAETPPQRDRLCAEELTPTLVPSPSAMFFGLGLLAMLGFRTTLRARRHRAG